MEKPARYKNKTKKQASNKPKTSKKRKSDGATCSMFLAELSRKLASKRRQEEESPANIVQTIIDSITNALPVKICRKVSKKESPVKIETLQTFSPELLPNDTLCIPHPIPIPLSPLVQSEDVDFKEVPTTSDKAAFKMPKMPLVNSEVIKVAVEKRRKSLMKRDASINTGNDAAAEITKHVNTLKKISLIAEEFNQKTAKNLKEIVDSVQQDLVKKLEEIQAEQRAQALAEAQAAKVREEYAESMENQVGKRVARYLPCPHNQFRIGRSKSKDKLVNENITSKHKLNAKLPRTTRIPSNGKEAKKSGDKVLGKLDDSGDNKAGPSKIVDIVSKRDELTKAKPSLIPRRKVIAKENITGTINNKGTSVKKEHPFLRGNNNHVQRIQMLINHDYRCEEQPRVAQVAHPIPAQEICASSATYIGRFNDNTASEIIDTSQSSPYSGSASPETSNRHEEDNLLYDWLTSDIECPRDNESGYRSLSPPNRIPNIKSERSNISVRSQTAEHKQILVSEALPNTKELPEKHKSMLIEPPTLVLEEDMSALVFTAILENTSKQYDNHKMDSKTDIMENRQDSSIATEFSSVIAQKQAMPSFVEHPSEMLQKTTNLEVGGCESHSTINSIATDIEARDDFSTGRDDCSIVGHSNIGWGQNISREDNRSMDQRGSDNTTVAEHSRYDDDTVTLEPSLLEAVPKTLSSLRRRMSLGICGKKLNRVWKKTTDRWTVWSTSHRLKRMHHIQRRNIFWEDVDLQTSIFIHKAKESVLKELKSEATSTIPELESDLNRTENSAGPSAKSKYRHVNSGPSMFPLFYNSNKSSILKQRSAGSNLSSSFRLNVNETYKNVIENRIIQTEKLEYSMAQTSDNFEMSHTGVRFPPRENHSVGVVTSQADYEERVFKRTDMETQFTPKSSLRKLSEGVMTSATQLDNKSVETLRTALKSGTCLTSPSLNACKCPKIEFTSRGTDTNDLSTITLSDSPSKIRTCMDTDTQPIGKAYTSDIATCTNTVLKDSVIETEKEKYPKCLSANANRTIMNNSNSYHLSGFGSKDFNVSFEKPMKNETSTRYKYSKQHEQACLPNISTSVFTSQCCLDDTSNLFLKENKIDLLQRTNFEMDSNCKSNATLSSNLNANKWIKAVVEKDYQPRDKKALVGNQDENTINKKPVDSKTQSNDDLHKQPTVEPKIEVKDSRHISKTEFEQRTIGMVVSETPLAVGKTSTDPVAAEEKTHSKLTCSIDKSLAKSSKQHTKESDESNKCDVKDLDFDDSFSKPTVVQMLDNVSDVQPTKELKEITLQAGPDSRDAETECPDAIDRRSASVLTSRCILPCPSICFCENHSFGGLSGDCLFVYGKPYCIVHDLSRKRDKDVLELKTTNSCSRCLKISSSVCQKQNNVGPEKETHDITKKGSSHVKAPTEHNIKTKIIHIIPDTGCPVDADRKSGKKHESKTKEKPKQDNRIKPISIPENRHDKAEAESCRIKCCNKLLDIPTHDNDEDGVRTHLEASCRYFISLLTKQLDVLKENFTRRLYPPCECEPRASFCALVEACTMKPSVQEEAACQTFKSHRDRDRTTYSISLNPAVSNTDICRHDKEHLQAVYCTLTAIEGRVRRLMNSVDGAR